MRRTKYSTVPVTHQHIITILQTIRTSFCDVSVVGMLPRGISIRTYQLQDPFRPSLTPLVAENYEEPSHPSLQLRGLFENIVEESCCFVVSSIAGQFSDPPDSVELGQMFKRKKVSCKGDQQLPQLQIQDLVIAMEVRKFMR